MKVIFMKLTITLLLFTFLIESCTLVQNESKKMSIDILNNPKIELEIILNDRLICENYYYWYDRIKELIPIFEKNDYSYVRTYKTKIVIEDDKIGHVYNVYFINEKNSDYVDFEFVKLYTDQNLCLNKIVFRNRIFYDRKNKLKMKLINLKEGGVSLDSSVELKFFF